MAGYILFNKNKIAAIITIAVSLTIFEPGIEV